MIPKELSERIEALASAIEHGQATGWTSPYATASDLRALLSALKEAREALEPFAALSQNGPNSVGFADVPPERVLNLVTTRSDWEKISSGITEPYVLTWSLTAGDMHRARTALDRIREMGV